MYHTTYQHYTMVQNMCDLKIRAKQVGMPGYSRMRKGELVAALNRWSHLSAAEKRERQKRRRRTTVLRATVPRRSGRKRRRDS